MRTRTLHHLLCESERCIRFISGRAALGNLLDNMPSKQRAFVPVFTCDTVLEPFMLRNIPIIRYHLDSDLSPILPAETSPQDVLLLTNYFGLTGHKISAIVSAHPGAHIVDAATALYSTPPANVPCFYSPRKFAEMPTGGLALAPFPLSTLPPRDVSDWQQLLRGNAHHSPQMQVILSERALRHRSERLGLSDSARWNAFDWETDNAQRCKNYTILHAHLQEINRLTLPNVPPEGGPMCYPLLSGIPNLRDELADAGLPLPLFWPEVIRRTSAECWENYLARHLLPLPLGPLLTEEDMLRFCKLILG